MIAPHVSGPQMPSTRNPRCSWNVRTAASVDSSKAPLMTIRAPATTRRCWRSRTASPRSPVRSSGAALKRRLRLGRSSDVLGELLEQLGLTLRADEALLHLAVDEDQQRRDTHHVVAARDVRVVVDVQLHDL